MKWRTHDISPTRIDYPLPLRPLGDRKLYGLGNVDLVGRCAVGICGSRAASMQALNYAYKFGWEAAKRGFVVVSGYARGVDRQAHKGALEAGGATIAVLAEGTNSFRLVQEIRPLVKADNFLAITMFESDAKWTAWRAMDRNKLIVALSVGLFVVEAREKGGTINAALECVKQGKPLWAIAYSNDIRGREGNKKLIQEAAIPLRRLGDLRDALDNAASIPSADVKQLVLDLV